MESRAPACIIAIDGQFLDQIANTVVADGLVVGRDVAGRGPVEVAPAHLQRIEAAREGHLLDHPFRRHHALRAAEAPEGRVRDRVGAVGPRGQVDGGVVVAIVGVEQGAVGDRPREVGCPAAAGGEGHVDGVDPAVLVEADRVVAFDIVALAGDDHVVVAVRPNLGRAPRRLGHQRRDAGKEVRLALLAAEAPAHTPHLGGDGGIDGAEHLGDEGLSLRGMLRRGVDRDLVVLAGDGKGDLAFEVEMLLAADTEAPAKGLRRLGERLLDVAADKRHRRPDQGAVGAGRLDGQDRGQILVGDHREARGPARGVAGAGRHGEDRLADIHHGALGEHGLVVAVRGGDLVDPRHVGGGEHADDAVHCPHGREVDRDEPGMRPLAEPKADMQQAVGLGGIVDVERRAGGMPGRAVMRAGRVGAALDPVGASEGRRRAVKHGSAPRRGRGWSRGPAARSRGRSARSGCRRPAADSRPRRACPRAV